MIVECDDKDRDDNVEDRADDNVDDAEEDAALDLERVVGPELVGPGPITCSNQRVVERAANECECKGVSGLCRRRSQLGTKGPQTGNVFTYADNDLHAVSMGNKHGSKVMKLTSVGHERTTN